MITGCILAFSTVKADFASNLQLGVTLDNERREQREAERERERESQVNCECSERL